MFIKKDLRKIPRILEDAVECHHHYVDGDHHHEKDNNVPHDDDAAAAAAAMTTTISTEPRLRKRSKVEKPLSVLRLGRRQQEFQGSIKILCQPSYLPKLQCLQNLNLYDCAIESLDGIGMMKQCPKLEILNLGRNPLTTLPNELSTLSGSLKELWLDGCQLTGPLPECVAQLDQLESLRVPNNQITGMSNDIVTNLTRLKCLVLDRNPFEGLPDDWSRLKQLEELHLRHIQLTTLPRRLPTKSLKVLHLSSNPLTNVDRLVDENNRLLELTHLYLNGCQLTHLPTGIVSKHPKLVRLVLSHNSPLTHAPVDMWHAIRGKKLVESSVDIVWQPNLQLHEGATVAPTTVEDNNNENENNNDNDETIDDNDDASVSDEDDAMDGVELSKE